ncbi:MAG: MarR family transcriptional regulator [Brachyspira sp.]|nr:MarR family transcriptional regulator [Brachyspira sp.]
MKQLDLLKSRIGMKLVRIGKMTRAIAVQRFSAKNFEITPEQLMVLSALIDHDGLYQRQIGMITLKDRPNITRIINILEKMNFVTRKPDVNKRKIYKIFVTDEGKNVVKKVMPTALELWENIVDGVDEDELEITLKVMNKFKENLMKDMNIQI